MKRFFLYIKFYFESNEKDLRSEAFDAAKGHFAHSPVRNAKNPYPHPIEYTRRREAFQAYQRAYMTNYRHTYAKNKLALIK